ncbi:MAG: heterodisulfide reductase-related iron-sulfur binding cluster [Candidatus Coatesbacteria bacterium]
MSASRRIVDAARLRACIHCGFCLTTCPTYALRGEEPDSPRGRIYFIRAMQEGRADPTPRLVLHLDRCLTCFACETACPSGVRYRDLIEDTRAWLVQGGVGHPAIPTAATRDWIWRWFFRNILPSARSLRLMLTPLWVAERLGLRNAALRLARYAPVPWMRRSTALLPARIPAPFGGGLAGVLPARGERRMRVGFILGCVMEGFFPDLNRLMIEILRELGAEVVVPRAQTCCGALAVHEGERDLAERLARRMIRTFAGHALDTIVANAGGCGATLKDYGRLLPDDPAAAGFAAKVRDFSEVAAALLPGRPPTHEVKLTVAYQSACHLGHAQKIHAEPRALLRAIPGITLVELPEQELCCGSAGVYNILEPAFAGELGARKAAHAARLGADAVVTANPGCYLQMQASLRGLAHAPRLLHLSELLALGYGLGPVQVPASKGYN